MHCLWTSTSSVLSECALKCLGLNIQQHFCVTRTCVLGSLCRWLVPSLNTTRRRRRRCFSVALFSKVGHDRRYPLCPTCVNLAINPLFSTPFFMLFLFFLFLQYFYTVEKNNEGHCGKGNEKYCACGFPVERTSFPAIWGGRNAMHLRVKFFKSGKNTY